MGELRPAGNGVRLARRWSFGDCVFDEAEWSLFVAGQRAHIECKPLEILRALLLRPGSVVPKDDLLDLIWPNVTVVEASLPTAMRKLRVALGDDRRKHCVIETVPGIGYRLAVPVVQSDGAPARATSAPPATPASPARRPRRAIGVAAALLAAASAAAVAAIGQARSSGHWWSFSADQQAQMIAMRKLDLPTIERMLADGWDPNATYDKDGTDALMYLLNMCEWDRDHDQRKMMLVARTLLEAGNRYERRNAFGDTAYSIAKAPRYCGPNHPVTVMLQRICYSGPVAPKDACLASYELERRQARLKAGHPSA